MQFAEGKMVLVPPMLTVRGLADLFEIVLIHLIDFKNFVRAPLRGCRQAPSRP
jgi:hypothetical protein